MPKVRRLKVGLGLLLAVAAIAAACLDANAVKTERVQRDDVDVVATPTPVPTHQHPLTGEVFTGKDHDWMHRPPLSVKVENSTRARPQAGLGIADVVFEELTEGGITRFLAVFHSRDAGTVGPVRSARHVDADIMGQIGGLFGYSGAVPPVISAVRSVAGVTDVGYDNLPSAYQRVRGRPSPHNLYTSTGALWGRRSGGPPQPLFQFLAEGQERPAGEPGEHVSFAFAHTETTRYAYDPHLGAYTRFHNAAPHVGDDGTHLAAVNVVVQRVPVLNGSYGIIGEGEVIVLTGGVAYRGRWIRPDRAAPTQLVDPAGNPILLSPGRTWVHLVPSGQPVTVR